MSIIKEKIKIAKNKLLTMHFDKKIGHIGGNLSCLDAMMVIHHQFMKNDDKFILSKGHAAGALYITLWSIGLLTDADLETFHADNTKLAGHPVSQWHSSIPCSSGSLGHGFSFALGVALGYHYSKSNQHVYCLTSDGEWQEGSTWEALIFFAHHRLTNLTILVDCNRLQGFGSTEGVASMGNLVDKIKAFNVNVVEVDGHDADAVFYAIDSNPGSVIILNTIKGHGVSFMENTMEWHYLPLNETQYKQAIHEISE